MFRGVRGGEDLNMLAVANLLAGVDVDKDGHRAIPLRRNSSVDFVRHLNEKRPQPGGTERWGRHSNAPGGGRGA